jgi:hypothetical protein
MYALIQGIYNFIKPTCVVSLSVLLASSSDVLSASSSELLKNTLSSSSEAAS